MDRRRYLTVLAAGVTAGAGCSEVGSPGGATGNATDTDASAGSPGAAIDVPVPKSRLDRATAKDAIPAIVDPVFGEDWEGVVVSAEHSLIDRRTAVRLTDEDLVVGVDRVGTGGIEGDAAPRAYPLKVLNLHEIVNDEYGGPLLVTYCPLCRTAVVAERRVAGRPTTFGVSGLLYRNNLVMYDHASESLWSQIAALSIRGVRTGSRLSLVPGMVTSWGEWRRDHPETVVLRPPPESSTVVPAAPRDYSTNPYADYQSTREAGYGNYSFEDERLHPKAEVLGIAVDGEAMAYPLEAILDQGPVNDRVGDLPVVVAATGESLVAYDRRVAGQARRFEAWGSDHLAAAGSRWRIADGLAVDGPNEGARLDRANDRPPMFWFAWLDFHPETEVYGA